MNEDEILISSVTLRTNLDILYIQDSQKHMDLLEYILVQLIHFFHWILTC